MSSGVKKRKNKAYLELAIYVAIITILALTSLNISYYLSPKKVLGAYTKQDYSTNINEVFWQSFLKKNPDYIPGQIEVGNLVKAKKIDPNYIIP